MTASDLAFLTLTALAERIRSRQLSPVEVTRALLERIDALDARLHSYVTVLPEAACAEAERAEAELARGHYRGPLHGVPIAVKDLCATKDVRTSCGARVMADRVPDHDAAVVERFRTAGAVLLGKLALTEGAFSQHHPSVSAPVNPWDASCWTGASSSGSGVATAAGLCFASLGSDTGGSIRFPSACCGLVGVKPTYGRVPLHGVFPLAASLDHVGPMVRSSADAAAVLQVIAGFDARDPASCREPVPDYSGPLDAGVQGIAIGVDERYCCEGVAPEQSAAVLAGAEVFRALGAEVREISMPPLDALLLGWQPTTAAEAAVAHAATFPSRADEYGPALRALLEEGARVSGTEYARAQAERRTFASRLAGIFEQVDLILCPSMVAPAPPLELMSTLGADPRALAPILRFTAPYDFSGSPAISLPCGFSEQGLPLSLQLVGRHLEEDLLCRAGAAFERATDFHTRHPPV